MAPRSVPVPPAAPKGKAESAGNTKSRQHGSPFPAPKRSSVPGKAAGEKERGGKKR